MDAAAIVTAQAFVRPNWQTISSREIGETKTVIAA